MNESVIQRKQKYRFAQKPKSIQGKDFYANMEHIYLIILNILIIFNSGNIQKIKTLKHLMTTLLYFVKTCLKTEDERNLLFRTIHLTL